MGNDSLSSWQGSRWRCRSEDAGEREREREEQEEEEEEEERAARAAAVGGWWWCGGVLSIAVSEFI